MKACSFPDCDKEPSGHFLCEGHRAQARRGQALRPLTSRKPNGEAPKPCSVADCANPSRKRGWCSMHYNRWRRHGSTDQPERTQPSGSSSWAWRGNEVGYVAAHQRVKRAKGSASDYTCIECGSGAEDWALQQFDNVLYGPCRPGGTPMAFSLNIEDYAPMCKSCHKILDKAQARSA